MQSNRLVAVSGLSLLCVSAAVAQQAAAPQQAPQKAPAQVAPASVPAGDRLPPRPGQLSPAPAQPVGPAGRFTPEATSFNFGKILSSNSVEHTFKFQNTGDANLIITSASGSCHCTVPQLSKSDYAPGESGEIRVIFDPKGKAAGPVQQRVTVVSNDPTSPTTSLMIEADVQPIVTIEPRILAFNQIPKGESSSIDVTVTGRLENFAVTDIKFDGEGDDIRAEIGTAEPIEINGEKLYKVPVKVLFPPAKKIERFNRNMIVTTNDSREKEAKIPVLGEVVGDLQTQPQRVTMGLVARTAEFSNTTTVSSRSNKPFKILGIKQADAPAGRKDPELAFDFQPTKAGTSAPSNSYTIAISGKAPNEMYRGVVDFDVLTDVPGEETVRMGVYIVVR